jgi:HD-GYP domain-containing protein (c-di-GMP phosphodiesterase class II)
LNDLWAEGKVGSFTLHRNRFFLNDQRIIYSPTMWAASAKIVEFFQERGFNSLKFASPDEELSDGVIVKLMDVFNRAKREADPCAWLKETLADDLGWVSVGYEEDKKISSDSNAQAKEIAGGKMTVVRGAASRELCLAARRTYGQALTVLKAMAARIAAGKAAGIQKAKRVVQELIDILFEDQAIFLALSTIRDREDQLFTHSANVAILSIGMGARLGLSRSSLEQLALCGLFHDLGKIGAAGEVASRPERLSGETLAKAQGHSLSSVFNILRLTASHGLKASMLRPTGEHHMGLDRSGYPHTDSDQPISLFGRILAAADQYDAMTSFRPWRPAPLEPREALMKLMEGAGSRLDPIILKVLVNLLGPWPVGSLLILDTKELAISSFTPPDAPAALPMARLLVPSGPKSLTGGAIADLSESSPATGKLVRNIVSAIHPGSLGIQPVDYLIEADAA